MRGWLRLEEEKWEHTRLLYALHYNINAEEKCRQTPAQLIPLRKDRRNALLRAPSPAQKVQAEADRLAMIARIKARYNLT